MGQIKSLSRCVLLTIVTFTAAFSAQSASKPEPLGWYAGDIHVHRSCGGTPVPLATIYSAMEVHDLSLVSLLADSGNGEVLDPVTDLPLVTGQDDAGSSPSRIVHWDAEWHWDAIFTQMAHQALGGHVLTLGITNATQVWEEYTFPILKMARDQGGVAGFAHMQYVGDSFPESLDCCTPIEYPVEIALEMADFISEDVGGSDSAMRAYYRLLNCGFRPGFAAGSDFPCNANIGELLTYVKVDGPLTYRKYIDGIKAGRTVVSRNAHKEFIDLKVNGSAIPGDELSFAEAASVQVSLVWTANENFTGSLELVQNGIVVASQAATVSAGSPVTLIANANFTKSGWLAARRMSDRGHEVHTGAIFVRVANGPIRTSVDDAEFYVDWMDQLIERTSVGGVWASFYENDRAAVHARIQQARSIYQQIALDAASEPWGISTPSLPAAFVNTGYSVALQAAGGVAPYSWVLLGGSLPDGLSFAPDGSLSGTPNQVGTFELIAQVSDSSTPPQVASKPFSFEVLSGFSLWPDSVPAVIADNDSTSVELGVKFQSSVDGHVSGIRFYKSSANVGTHIGNLWSSSGNLLATVQFTNETSEGWQFQRFPAVVPILANTTYVVSYHTSVGRYSVDAGYFAQEYSNPPLRALAKSEGGNGVYRYGPSGFPDQTWAGDNYWVDILFEAGLVEDSTPPAIVMRSPGPDEIGVSPTTAISVTFSEPISIESINNQTLILRDSSGSIVVSTASYNQSTSTAILQPNTSLDLLSSYSITVLGGAEGITDTTGNPLTDSSTWTFTTASSSPRTIWDSSVVPALIQDPDTAAVELGTKFQSAVMGAVTGIRFYKGPANSGPHIGNLWSSAGTLLGTVSFDGETASGWQTAHFSNPIEISPNTTYVVSYHAPAGRYSASSGYFLGAGFSNFPLRVLAHGEEGGNGVYRYGPSGFPSQSWGGANYWVDVTFQPTLDTNAPQILSFAPADGLNNVSVLQSVSVTFSEAMDPAKFNSSTFTLEDSANHLVPGTVSYDANSATVVFVPATPLDLLSTYTATVVGNSSGVTDLAGNPLEETLSWQFTTASQAPRTLWANEALPNIASNNDSDAVELGLKFSSAVDGLVTGVRFYKGNGNTGPHRGNLWDISGNLLATVAFQNETSSGWQFQAFTTPVTISANTPYVISYHAPAGHYSLDAGYFVGGGFSNYPLRALANGENGGNGIYRYGSTGFPNQSWNGGNYWVDLAFEPMPDTSAPTVIVAEPGANAVGVFPESPISIQFSEALEPATVTSSSIRLVAPGNTTVEATLSYNAETATVLITPSASLALQTAYTIRALDGPTGVKDLAGNSLASEFTSSFTTIGEVPSTIWPNSTVPAVITDPDAVPIELGLKFRSHINGYIAGVRFYKSAENIGPHTGNVWSATGALLGTVSFQNETPAGWQYQPLPSPVPVTANTTYVVSYHTQSGHYSINDGYFLAGPVVNSPLTALSNVEGGGNGLYQYGSSGFPTQTYNGANFWVDVLFVENLGPDTTPPSISSVTPAQNATGVLAHSGLTVHFSETIDASKVNSSTLLLRDAQNNPVPVSVSYGNPPYTAAITPANLLAPSSTYTAIVKGGGNGIADPSGNYLAADFEWTFTTAAPDTFPPSVSSVSPYSGATGVGTAAPLNATVTFNEPVDTATVSAETFLVRDSSGNVLPATVSLNGHGQVVTLVTDSALVADATYTATVKGGASGIADILGNRMVSDFTWSFKTISSNPYGAGPGGPILIVTDESNPFSLYNAEILLTEGLNSFSILDRDALTPAVLSEHEVVILGSFSLSPVQASMLSSWVNNGGNLIAMRPDKQLAGLAGLSDQGTTLSEGYLLVDTTAGPGLGIVGETMQFHGTADRYTLDGASVVATLYSNAQSATQNPAVTVRNYGSSGGQVVVFTYDLAKSVVLTRQGNPAWADQDRDGNPPLRSNDLFYGASASDPQPDWNDFNKIAIPQADEQQRLLANLILSVNSDRNLLPRFWYFPHGHKAAVVMTGDDHALNGSTPRFDQYIAYTPTGASLNDWEAVRGSSYVWNNTPISDNQAAYYNSLGFELALHVNTDCSNYSPSSLHQTFTKQLNSFREQFPSLPSPTTLRMHCINWSGYTILPETCLNHGIRLETSYYYFPEAFVQDRPGLFTGSGMAMRFAKSNGEVIDVYQAATPMTDESGQEYPYTCDVLLDRALGPEGFYGAFVANMHTDVNPFPQSDAVVTSAQARGVPVISALQLLTWLDAKNASSFGSVVWSNNRQSFSIQAASSANGLQAIVPVPAGYNVTTVKRDGTAVAHKNEFIKGVLYVMFPASSGNYEVDYAVDTAPPSIVAVDPASGAVDIDPLSPVSVTFNEAVDPGTVNPTTLQLKNPQGTSVAASTSYDPSTFIATVLPDSPLIPGTTYTVQISAGSSGITDLAGNGLLNTFTSSFNTVAQVLHSIWSDTATPAILADPDTSAVELGLKFRSSVSGHVSGVRFYKGPGNTGTHRGNLWAANGALLGTVVFNNETASGWQQAFFSTPIAINANTTYVISYHAPVGRYSANAGYFTGSGVDQPPLRALSSSESGGNGVYRYSSTSAFPNQTWNGGNYWVDVIFQTNP